MHLVPGERPKMPAKVSARLRRFERRCTKWWDPGRGPKARTRLWTAQTWDREICKVPLRARAPAGRRIPKRLETAMPPGPSCDWLGGMSGLRPRAPPASCGSWAHARHAAKQHAGASREEHSESVVSGKSWQHTSFHYSLGGPSVSLGLGKEARAASDTPLSLHCFS